MEALLRFEVSREGVTFATLRPYPTFYRAYTDTAGGTGRDAYTISVGHKENDRFVLDVVRGTVSKFDPQSVTADYAKLLKQYRVTGVMGDHYAAEWVTGAWRDTGIVYSQSDLTKSEIYLECLPLFTRGLVRLPNHARQLRELRLLERTAHRGGRESVDHPRGGHDDYANAVCGVLRVLSAHLGFDSSFSWVDTEPIAEIPGNETEEQRKFREAAEWRRRQFSQYLSQLKHPDLNMMTGRPR